MTEDDFEKELAELRDRKAALDVLLAESPAGHVFHLVDLPDVFPGMRDAIRIYQALGASFGPTVLLRIDGAPGTYLVQKIYNVAPPSFEAVLTGRKRP